MELYADALAEMGLYIVDRNQTLDERLDEVGGSARMMRGTLPGIRTIDQTSLEVQAPLAFLISTGARRAAFGRLELRATPDGPISIVDPRDGTEVLTILDALIEEQPATQRLRLTGEVVLAPDAATVLDRPDLTYVAVGRIRIDGPADVSIQVSYDGVERSAANIDRAANASESASTTEPARNDRDGNGSVAAIGPDVIVGSLPSVMKFYASGGRAAFAVGTTSCNIGDQNLKWHADTNEHPVIAQNLYRLYDGRFEQIGMSWLKHGFYALSGSVCFPDCRGTDGTELGVHCSDPYSASLNGTQINLGPRWQVNASTGEFPYPPANPPITDLFARRLIVDTDDLDPFLFEGAEYFVEGHYVTADDAQAGNGNNNASHRRVTVSGRDSGVELVVAESTRRYQPAIFAWRNADPDVLISNVDIPGDGRVIVASRAYDSGGYWRYEYAIQNLSSDRAIRELRVPIDPSFPANLPGFRDIEYHSGEWQGSTDWTVNISPVSVRWTGPGAGTSLSANALRWGTLYNFWFQSKIAPQTSMAELSLFKPGKPDTVTAAVVGPITNSSDCNGNEQADSVDIAEGISNDCNENDIPDECESSGPMTVQVGSGFADVVDIASNPDDSAELYVASRAGRIDRVVGGAPLANPLLDIGGNLGDPIDAGLMGFALHPNFDQSGRFFVYYLTSGQSVSVVEFVWDPVTETSTAGTTVWSGVIDDRSEVGGHLAFGPDGMLYVTASVPTAGNDPGNLAQDTSSLFGKILRFDVDAPPDFIPIDNPFVDTALPLDEIWGSGLRRGEHFSFDAMTGELYLTDSGAFAEDEINIDPSGAGGRNYGWRCTEGLTCTGLGGCTCGGPSLRAPSYAYERAPDECGIVGGFVYRGCQIPGLSGWYLFADRCSGRIYGLSVKGGAIIEQREWTGTLTPQFGSIGPIAAFGADADGELYIASTSGGLFQIVPNPAMCGNGITEFGEECDDGNANFLDGCDPDCLLEPGEAHNSCDAPLAVVEGAIEFTTVPATTDGGPEPAACGTSAAAIEKDLWFSYSPSCTGTATISTCGSPYDSRIAAYDVASCPDDDSAFACSDNDCGDQSLLSLPVTACSPLLLRVGGAPGSSGAGVLTIACDPDPITSDCNGNAIDDAVDLLCGGSTDGNSNSIPDECETAGDRVVGGRLYDNWWTELELEAPAVDHPLWASRPDQVSNLATGAETWRCVQCHGWDYAGASGQFASGPSATGFPGILGTTRSAEDLAALLRDPPDLSDPQAPFYGHDYGQVLSELDINNLVAFSLSGAIDTSGFIDPGSGTMLGNTSLGASVFSSATSPSCRTCHGSDGSAINFGAPTEPVFLGTILNDAPWEALHRIRFSLPAGPMPSLLAGGRSDAEAAAVAAYIQSFLPVECTDASHCDDGIACTVESCGGDGLCVFTPSDALCEDDGVFCNGSETCDAELGCVSEGTRCLGDCDEVNGCGCPLLDVEAVGGRYLQLTIPPEAAEVPMRISVAPMCSETARGYLARFDSDTGAFVAGSPGETGLVMTGAEWGTNLLAVGTNIIPGSQYAVRADCGVVPGDVVSADATASTWRFGDSVSSTLGGRTPGPDGVVDLADILAPIDRFLAAPGAPPLTAVDWYGCLPSGQVDILDVLAAVDGFLGKDYATASLCPVPCQ